MRQGQDIGHHHSCPAFLLASILAWASGDPSCRLPNHSPSGSASLP